MLAEEAVAALAETDLPPATVQLLYKVDRASGQRMVADPRVGASAFTGGRAGGLALKAAADKAGKPTYLEMSSINPVVVLPGALAERGAALAEEYAASTLLGGGQFCTNPGLVMLFEGDATEQFIAGVTNIFDKATPATLLSAEGARSLAESVKVLREAGAQLVTAGVKPAGPACRHPNTLLRVNGRQFLAAPEALQTEAFGASALAVVVHDADEACGRHRPPRGQLDRRHLFRQGRRRRSAYGALEPRLRQRVGRLLNDKMPTGVAVSPAMNHGGPYPATGHPASPPSGSLRPCAGSPRCTPTTTCARHGCLRRCATRVPTARCGGLSTAGRRRRTWAPNSRVAIAFRMMK
jgi:NADP-dependent aldehyde dehydrogenase